MYIWINSLPNDNILEMPKLKAFADDKMNKTPKTKICFGKDRKHSRKRRKCWLPAFSPFPTMFSKRYFLRIGKSRDYVVELSKLVAGNEELKKMN